MIRSYLYVPASSEKFLGKAHERGADALILDLEDAVAPGEKPAARARLGDAVPSARRNGAKVFVRINALATGLALDDAAAAARAGADGLFVPKLHAPEDVHAIAAHLATVERAIGREQMVFVALLEDAAAVLDARIIAAASPRIVALGTGGEDLATDMGAEPTPEVLRTPKLLVHLAAKAQKLASIGLLRSVADYRDVEGVRRSAREARLFGFDGATCVHPSLVAILNEAFSPSAEEIARAQAMVAAFDTARSAGAGAFAFEGKMVDEPVVARARALLAAAGPRAGVPGP
jgi:citrate lyase subunit beta/citryl-CoA lyase